eukprot:tig00000459_g1156.t1
MERGRDVFCCGALAPYKPQRIDHEAKFDSFMRWQKSTRRSSLAGADFVIQAVKQKNFGRLLFKRYFLHEGDAFREVTERDLIQCNYAKVNTFKNFKCAPCDFFYELNLYERDPVNKHHLRADVARPASDIDLPFS